MKIYIISLLALSVLLHSCDDPLFKDNTDKYGNEYLVISDGQEAADLFNGVYNRLAAVHDRNYLKALIRSDDINLYSEFKYPHTWDSIRFSDTTIYHIVVSGTSGITWKLAIYPSNESGGIYFKLYQAISNLNRLILQLSATDNKKLLGEAYFLRAYCYFKLARFFGTPPLIADIDVKYFIEKPTYREVYEFIEADMLKALELLPENHTGARVPGETPHRGMAKAVLAEIYLAMAGYPVNDVSKYAEAARLAGEVIEAADQYNFGLLDDIGDLWKKANRHNKETIFGLYFIEGSEQNTINIKWELNQWTIGRNTLSNQNSYSTGMKFFRDFPNQYRKEVSFTTSYIFIDWDTIQYFPYSPEFFSCVTNPFCDNAFTEIKMVDPAIYPLIFIMEVVSKKQKETNKVIGFQTGAGAWQFAAPNTVTLYLFRYAHTLLTYAEAKTRAGQMDETCFEAVNMVRRRANKADIYSPSEFDLPPDLSPEQFLDSVVWERAWELCQEPEGRWFDILRLDLKDKLPDFFLPNDKYASLNSKYFTKDWYFYLIPVEDRLMNPNFEEDND